MTIAQGFVEGNGTDKIVSGSWIAIAFEDDAKVGHFRPWIGMIQRIIYRPKIKGKNPSLWTSSLALDDARIKEMWLNMAWLTPSNGVAPRDALQYEWMAYADAEEVCASYIINVPEVTLCQDTHKYILCAHDLRRLNDYLDSTATSIEPICEPRVAGSKKKSKQKPTSALEHYPRVYTQEKGSRPLPRSCTSDK